MSARATLFLSLMIVTQSGCNLLNHTKDPETLPDEGPVVFPYDITRECIFQSTKDATASLRSTWTAAGDLSNRPFVALTRQHDEAKRPEGSFAEDAVQVRDASGQKMWLRLEPHANAPSRDPMNCAISLKTLESLDKALRATRVRILPTAPSCHGLDLLTGETEDVDFQPYSVLMRRLYRSSKGFTLGVTLGYDPGASLQGGGRARLLTVTEDQFNGCFAATTRTPLPLDRRRSFFDWFAHASEQATPPPEIPLDPALVLLGIDEQSCLREGSGASQHRECRAAAIGVRREDGSPSEIPSIGFVRERTIDAVHGYGDELIGGSELAGTNYVLTPPSGKSAMFAKQFDAAVNASVTDAQLQVARAIHGYRLLRRSDLAKVSAPFISVQLDVTVSKSAPRADAPIAAPAASASAESPAATTKPPGPRSEADLPTLFGLNAPSCVDPSAPAICNMEGGSTASLLLRTRAQSSVPAAPPAVSSAAPPSEATSASAPTRAGEITLKLTATTHDSNDADAARVVLGTTRAPIFADGNSADDFDRAAAQATAQAADHALETWMSRSIEHPPQNALLPGTRAYLTLLARHTASNRPVKLVTDLLDQRPETVTSGKASYPIQLTDAPPGECFTFVATASDGAPADVDLAVFRDDSKSSFLVARDRRAELSAAVESCNFEPGSYRIDLAIKGATKPQGVNVAIFDSTPGKVADVELRAASDGSPLPLAPSARGAEVPR